MFMNRQAEKALPLWRVMTKAHDVKSKVYSVWKGDQGSGGVRGLQARGGLLVKQVSWTWTGHLGYELEMLGGTWLPFRMAEHSELGELRGSSKGASGVAARREGRRGGQSKRTL